MYPIKVKNPKRMNPIDFNPGGIIMPERERTPEERLKELAIVWKYIGMNREPTIEDIDGRTLEEEMHVMFKNYEKKDPQRNEIPFMLRKN